MSRIFPIPKIISPWSAPVAAILAGMYPLPSLAQQQAISDYVTTGDGWWAVADCWHTFLAATDKNSEINWPQPGFANLTKSGAPAFADYTQPTYGWTGNGTNGQLSFGKGRTAMTHFTQNASAYILDVASTAQDANFALALLGNGNLRFTPRNTSDQVQTRLNTTTSGFVNGSTNASGVWAVVRTSSTNVLVYRNGALFGTVTATSNALENSVLAYFSNATQFSSHRLLGGGIFGLLTAPQVADHYAKWTAFKAAFLAG